MSSLENSEPHPAQSPQTAAEKEEERRKLRRLQILVGMVSSLLSQDPDLTAQQSRRLIEECKATALAMFPGKELAFDLIYKPRLERVAAERFRSS